VTLNLSIAKISDRDEKLSIVREVLADLSEWFGIPEAVEEYIKEAGNLPLWAAKVGENNAGFVTLRESSKDCGEIHCMGVKKLWHRQRVGTLLMNALIKEAKNKYEYLQVKTLDEGQCEYYDRTIRFYRNCGFRKLEVFPTLWSETNPCLIMIMKIG